MTTTGRLETSETDAVEADAVPLGPIVAPSGASAATASHPETRLDGSYHIYDAHPAPWWIAVIWVAFFVFAVTYLITNLIE